jgi:asparagine synthase (glutamine-hydrolysing)
LDEVEGLYAECAADSMDLDRIQRVMVRTFLSENILSYADSVSMDQSTELRLPFLDRDLVNFVMRVPARQRVRFLPTRRSTKALLRAWGDRYMDPEIVNAKKKSFNFGSLRPLMQSHGAQLKSYVLDSEAVRAVIPGAEAWLSKPPEYFRGCWQGTLWALLALGVWAEANELKPQ